MLDVRWSHRSGYDTVQARWAEGLRRRTFPLLCAVFFLSGFSALVYQTAWQRMLGLFAGSDAVAATLVVGAFLFGLGIGSLVGAVIADRLSDRGAILGFAGCEVGIGLFALASKLVLNDLLFQHVVPLHPGAPLVALIVLAALFVPTLLMGMSLPLLARAAVTRIETASSRIGLLYGVNTFGAAVGAGLGGFVLIGTMGYVGAVSLGAAINLAVGSVAVALALRMRPTRVDHGAQANAVGGRSTALLWGWGLAVFVSGFLIISLEIVWFRLVGAMMQSTAYSFALVLALFLVGDAMGILVGAWVVRRVRRPRHLFMLLQAGMALLAMGALLLVHVGHVYFDLASWFVLDTAYQRFGTLGGELRLLAWLLLAGASVVPAAFLLGMSFPIAQKAVQQDLGEVGRRVGLIQLANILGNTVGALITGLVFLHLIGTSGTLLLVGVAGFLFAVALADDRREPWTFGLAGAVGLCLLVLPDNQALWARIHGGDPVDTLVGEDRTGTAVVFNLPDDQVSGAQALYVGGRWQSQMNPYSPVQGALGLLAAHVHPDPRSVLVVGYGGGGSVWAVTSNPAIERIHVVEIVEPVVSVMNAYTERQRGSVPNAFADPRVSTTIADARHQLLVSPETYDVIVAEAIVPEAAHSGLLFSVEYFRQVRERLKPGGIVVEWVPTQRTLNTFRKVFPYVVRTGRVLIGSNEPIDFSLEAFAERLRGPARPHLEQGGWQAEDVMAWLTSVPLQRWTPDDPPPLPDINTDLFPKDEYFLNNGRRW